MSGICGSDLATVDGRSSRWFEPIVSFPFVPGHEVVADTEDGRRVVDRAGPWLRGARHQADVPGLRRGPAAPLHEPDGWPHIAWVANRLLQRAPGGGWSLAFVAHESQLHPVPENLPDEAAVLVEPAACAVHAALSRLHAGSTQAGEDLTAVVIGAGTLGLCVIAALSRFREDVTRVIAVAKHPHQRELANRLGATSVAEPGELRRAVRRATGSWALGSGQLSGGAPLVIDCVGTASSVADALAVTAPGGESGTCRDACTSPHRPHTPVATGSVASRLVYLRPRTCHGWAAQFRPSIRTG